MSQSNSPLVGADSPTPESGDIATRIDRIPPGPFHIRLAACLGAGTFFDSFDALSIAVVLSLIVNSFGISLAEAGVIISAGYAGQWLGMVTVGALADRYGRRRPFIGALALFGAMSLLCAFAWDQHSLLLFRAIQGIGLGAEIPIAAILMSEFLGRRGRGRIFTLYESVFAWGIFFAPLTALACTSALGPETGWRVLLAIGALPLVIAVWAWFALPESPRWLALKGHTAEAEALVAQMESETLSRGRELPAPLPATAPADTTFRFGELLSPRYRRRTLMLALVWFTNFFVNYGCLTWLPTMYVKIGGLPHSQALWLTTLTSAGQLVVVYVVAVLIDRIGRRPLLIGSLTIAALGAVCGVVIISVLHITAWPALFVSGAVMVLGTTAPGVALYLYTGELYPTRMRGWATSVTASLGKVASMASPSIFGFMLGGRGGPSAVFVALAIAAAIALAAIAIGGIETRGRSLEEISA